MAEKQKNPKYADIPSVSEKGKYLDKMEVEEHEMKKTVQTFHDLKMKRAIELYDPNLPIQYFNNFSLVYPIDWDGVKGILLSLGVHIPQKVQTTEGIDMEAIKSYYISHNMELPTKKETTTQDDHDKMREILTSRKIQIPHILDNDKVTCRTNLKVK